MRLLRQDRSGAPWQASPALLHRWRPDCCRQTRWTGALPARKSGRCAALPGPRRRCPRSPPAAAGGLGDFECFVPRQCLYDMVSPRFMLQQGKDSLTENATAPPAPRAPTRLQGLPSASLLGRGSDHIHSPRVQECCVGEILKPEGRSCWGLVSRPNRVVRRKDLPWRARPHTASVQRGPGTRSRSAAASGLTYHLPAASSYPISSSGSPWPRPAGAALALVGAAAVGAAGAPASPPAPPRENQLCAFGGACATCESH
jgi:hypothetical protein